MLTSIGDQWHDLFVMAGGAAAALAGLLFVAVSLNHEEVLKHTPLPTLAGQSVSVLLGVLVVSVVMLVPEQDVVVLGAELLVVAVLLAAVVLVPTLRRMPELQRFGWRAGRLGVALASVVPLLVGAVLLIGRSGAGMVLVVLELVVGFVAAAYNAWVLLIEIRRSSSAFAMRCRVTAPTAVSGCSGSGSAEPVGPPSRE